MEVKNIVKYCMKVLVVFGGIFCISACNSQESSRAIVVDIHFSETSLFPFAPNFSISARDTLCNQYLYLSEWGKFPLVGILRVDGKAYRFLGGDSLRIQALAPLAGDSCGWMGKYSFLYPGAGWEKLGYDDSEWLEGRGAWGTEGLWYVTNTYWDAAAVYVRRYINIDKDKLQGRKLYIRYIFDDLLALYCNGNNTLNLEFTPNLQCVQLADSIKNKFKAGENVIAAYCRDIGGDALLDYGLYIENMTYDGVATATLKTVDKQATQAHYSFQCGEVELQLNFILPSLLRSQGIRNFPLGFITYQVLSTDGKRHDIEICFDLDMEWLFGKVEIESSYEESWRIWNGGNFYLAIKEKNVESICNNRHVVLTQKEMGGNNNKGVLLLGYEETNYLQYFGENLFPYRDKGQEKKFKDVLKRAGNDYQILQEECDVTDMHMSNRVYLNMGKKTAEQIIPFYCEFIQNHRFLTAPDGELLCIGDTVGKIRDAYECFPYLLILGRMDWMKGLLKPVFDCCENRRWHKKHPPYDIGVFPFAIRQESIKDHGVEMAANMLIMTMAIVEREDCFDYAERHWEVLSQWGSYLEEIAGNIKIPTDQIVDERDERVKIMLGLMAYTRLTALKEDHG